MDVCPQIQKSPSDSRTYKAIKLTNQIECVLISDPDTQKSSAAMSVGVGSMQDPPQTQGLAHYLEHMLFMGTSKYPEENEYSNFITKNSGSNNAYTSQEETNYHFEVASLAFEDTLDRFAQFFISPLMLESSSQRQILAVDSEHSNNLNNDLWRMFQLSKHIARQDHPYCKFSTGNKQTLACSNLRNMLHNFYQSKYSSNLMKLAVYAKEPVEVLEQWARDKFSAVANKNYSRFQLSDQPYDSSAFGKMVKAVPVKDKKKLSVVWVLSNFKSHYRNHPGTIVSNLVGHEGKGSLMSYLMREGLATSLVSSSEDSFNCYSEFSIELQLTEKGLERVNEIIGNILFYIEMLKKEGVPEWFFQEIKLINTMKFDFMEKKKGLMQTAKTAKVMHDRKVEELIIYPYLMEQWHPQLINQYLKELTLSNGIVFLQAQKLEPECTSEQPIYKTKFLKVDLPELQPIPCPVSLPPRNTFIPRDHEVLPMQLQKLPEKIYQSEYMEFFYKADHRFQLPKVELKMRLYFPGNCSVDEEVNRAILLEMLKEHLREFVYLAEMANIEQTFSFVSYFAIELSIKCYRDSLQNFVTPFLGKIFDFVPEDSSIFQTVVEKITKKYSNFFLSQPYALAYDYNTNALRHAFSVSNEEKLAYLPKANLEGVTTILQALKRSNFCEAYLGGNISQEGAIRIATICEQSFQRMSEPLAKELIRQIRPVQLASTATSVIEHELVNKQQSNSSVIVHFQAGVLDLKLEATLKLSEACIKEPAFDFLRTKHQLGYIVFCLAEDHRGVGGLAIIVQSAVKPCHQLVAYIDKFFNEHLKEVLEQLNDKTFETVKSALKHASSQPDKHLSEETNRFWGEIVKHKYQFNRKQQLIETISSIHLPEFKQFIQQLLYDTPKRLETHFTSEPHQQLNELAKQERIGKSQTATAYSFFKSNQLFLKNSTLYPDQYTAL